MDVQESYGDGLKVAVSVDVDWAPGTATGPQRPKVIISVDEDRIRAMLTPVIQEQARKIAEQIALDLVVVAVKNEREMLAKRVRDMGHGGRLGMDEKQVELLAAAIEGLAEQSAEMLTGTATVNEDGTITAAGIASKEALGSVAMIGTTNAKGM